MFHWWKTYVNPDPVTRRRLPFVGRRLLKVGKDSQRLVWLRADGAYTEGSVYTPGDSAIGESWHVNSARELVLRSGGWVTVIDLKQRDINHGYDARVYLEGAAVDIEYKTFFV